jgi:radical SAM superfamily enzyme YgiQ (UPF0313 family)
MKANGRRLRNAGGVATMEPLGLAYVAALTPPHWEVRIVDEVGEDIPANGTWGKPDLVGLTSLTITAPEAYELCRRYQVQGVPVVMGGVHASLQPDEAVQYADVVFQGEAESNWPSLIHDFEAGKLKRRYNGAVSPINRLPWPRRELYQRRYFLQLVSGSRGCRYRCSFCTLWKLDGGQYRKRPPVEVLAELASVEHKLPVLFTDENIFTDREWALSLFQGMAERGQERHYAVQASLDIADDSEMLAALSASGCMTVLIGFESVSDESLRLMRKGVNLRVGVNGYGDKIAKLHDHGLASSGTFMFGNDGDGPDIFERTAEFVVKSGMDVAHFGLLTPYPGTDLYDRLAQEDRLLYTSFPEDYGHYDLRTAVFRPQQMTVDQLEEGLVWATQAVGKRSVAAQRAWHTWRETANPLMAAIAYRWNRSGLFQRVLERPVTSAKRRANNDHTEGESSP